MRILQIVLDAGLVTIGLFAAYMLRFEGHVESTYLKQFAEILPIFVLPRLLEIGRAHV